MSAMSETLKSGQDNKASGFLGFVAAVGMAVGGLLLLAGILVGLHSIESPLDSSVSCGSALFAESGPGDAGFTGDPADIAATKTAELACSTARTNELILTFGLVGLGAFMFMSGALMVAAGDARP